MILRVSNLTSSTIGLPVPYGVIQGRTTRVITTTINELEIARTALLNLRGLGVITFEVEPSVDDFNTYIRITNKTSRTVNLPVPYKSIKGYETQIIQTTFNDIELTQASLANLESLGLITSNLGTNPHDVDVQYALEYNGTSTPVPPPTPTTGITLNVVCSPSDIVGACVTVSGIASPDVYNVATVDLTQWDPGTAIGVLISKNTATTGIVQVSGIVKGVYVGLTPGATYVASVSGQITRTPPAPGIGQRIFVQKMGWAMGVNEFLVSPSVTVTIRQG